MLRVLLITILGTVSYATHIYAQKATDNMIRLLDSTVIAFDTTKTTSAPGPTTISSPDSKVFKPVTTAPFPSKKPELFNSGFIDF